MNPVVKELKKVGYRHYTVSSLKLLFGGDGEHCLRNRKLLQKILSDTDLMWKEIEGNCQIKSNSDKKHKRIACKVMSLRSLSPLLMERLQTKWFIGIEIINIFIDSYEPSHASMVDDELNIFIIYHNSVWLSGWCRWWHPWTRRFDFWSWGGPSSTTSTCILCLQVW